MSPPPLLTRVLCDLGPSTAQLEVLSALAIQLSEIPGRSANLSNHFADLLAQAGLRERAPHHWSKGKGRNSQRASNSLSFHSLRHTAVSLLKNAGIPEGVVMELVGHDSKSMSAHSADGCKRHLKAVRHIQPSRLGLCNVTVS
jgi:integrase